MAVYKLFPTQDATLYSLYPTMNTGLDAILEVSNQIGINGTPDVARYLIQFDTSEIQDVIDNKISNRSSSIYLKNFIAEAQGINQNTKLEIRDAALDFTSALFNAQIFTTTPQSIDRGGSLSFGGETGGGTTAFGAIRGGKENSTFWS